jgi:tetratricopeptide (TPR) repeat protein
LGISASQAYRAAQDAITQLQALQQALDQPPEDLLTNFSALKEQIEATDQAVKTLRAKTRIFNPLLSVLGWVPRYGPELAATPHLTALAVNLSGSARDLAVVIETILPILEEGGEGSLARAIIVLQEHSSLLESAHAGLRNAAHEQRFLDPADLDSGPFAEVGPFLETLDPLLPEVDRALGLFITLLPHADALLGLDAPKRYLLLGQSNFELRATGGFLGSMGVLTVEEGRITNLDYRRSYDWDNPDREKVEPPFPYVRYMRFGAWFIRDANWYADFPTSAQNVERFWGLDGHEPVDGVIAVDLYALQSLVEAVGPVTLPDYGISIKGPDALETIWENYRLNRDFLPYLTAAVAEHLQKPDLIGPENLPTLLQALERALQEKHILLFFDEPELEEAIVETGWSGAINSDPGDYLFVVDSDLSYAEVNRFVEQEIHYRVSLDPGFTIRESTVTISYWNHFDEWASGETQELFGGACFDPETEELVHSPGCYGDYVRLYVPQGSSFISAEGFDEGIALYDESGRTVMAGYVRIFPGQHRTVSITYVSAAGPVDGQYRLALQKQPGTDALPVEVEIEVRGSEGSVATLSTDLRTDRQITADWSEGQLVLSGGGTSVTQMDPQARVQQLAFAEGYALWQDGRRDDALARWRQENTIELVLDQANLLLSHSDLAEAEALCIAALELGPDLARAHFLLGRVRLETGDDEAAEQAFETALALEPENRVARLELGLLYEASGLYEEAYAQLQHADPAEASQILWQRIWQHFNNGEGEAGLGALNLLIRLAPQDPTARFVLGDQLRRLERYDQALAAFEAAHEIAPEDVWFYVGRGKVYAEQGLGEQAIADFEQAVDQAPENPEAWFLLGRYLWEFRQDVESAVAALEKALELHPNAWYATVLGNVHREAGNLDAAVMAYNVAVRLPGSTAYTWVMLGNAQGAQENWDRASAAYAEAVALDPDNAQLHATLADAYEKAGRLLDAIAEYEAALALEPGRENWERALERLRE